MPQFISDTLREVPFYLKVEQLPLQIDSLEMSFGRYEFLPTDSHHILFSVDSLATTHLDSFLVGNAGMPMPFSLWVNSVFFLLFVAYFVIFSLVFRKEGGAIIGNFRQLLSVRKHHTTGYKGQVTTIEVWGEFFLVLQAILLFAIVLYTFLRDQQVIVYSIGGNIFFFIGLLMVPAVIILSKLLMYKAIGSFFMQSDMKRWINRYYRLVELMGILLFLPTLFYVFMPELRNDIAMFFLFIFIMSRIAILFGLLNIFVKNKIGGFYFFVYLCGTEIAPYLLYYKGLLSLISIAGNNIV